MPAVPMVLILWSPYQYTEPIKCWLLSDLHAVLFLLTCMFLESKSVKCVEKDPLCSVERQEQKLL
jgi:hypothetical protein